MYLNISRDAFKKTMKLVKEDLISGKIIPHTCNIISDRFEKKEPVVKCWYDMYIDHQLNQCFFFTLASYKTLDLICDELVEVLRYVLLDSFEQEVLSTCKFKGE